jgi:SagB-type dehydrogenase family enzyme
VITFRRSRHLVSFWKSDTCIVRNFRTRTEAALTLDILRLLDAITNWSDAEDIAQRIGLPVEPIRAILDALVALSFVVASDRPEPNDAWEAWDPAAGFFHFSTRGTVFNSDVAAGEQRLMKKAAHTPAPAPTSSRQGRKRLSLPKGSSPSALEAVLRERRTWRTFATTPLPIEDLADLLRLTVGVQKWGHGPARERIALKTSPSGGICHPIEAYVVATRVDGLAAGIYHYDAANHELALLQDHADPRLLNTFIQAQPWYGEAPVLFLFTAVFDRTAWRYPIAKAYRNILLEAGHICQTFYLLATERGLAPFCTHAIDEDSIDRALGIDGVSEGVVYVAGCGQRPPEGWSLGLPPIEGWVNGELAG